MKRVCYVTTVPMTLDAFVLPVVRRLQKMTDWQITVICDPNAEFAAGLPDGVRYLPVSMKRGISLGGIGAMLKMAKIFRKEKFDLVQYSTPNAALYASLAACFARVPVRLYCQWGIAYVGFQGLKRKIFKAVEKLVCRCSTWVEPDSFGNLRFSHEQGLYPEKKGSVVWNGSACGVDLAKFDVSCKNIWRQAVRERYGIAPDATVYGFVGRINRDKGINELLEAARGILEQNNDTWLMLVGREENTQILNQQLLAWARENDHVIFCGQTDVVEQYLSAMDVYILPSYREGFGSGVVEAEAMGVSVIVSDIPGPTDAMRRDITGLVVPKQDAEALRTAMEQLGTDKQLQAAFGQAGIEFATSSFAQDQLAKHILADRKRLLGE